MNQQQKEKLISLKIKLSKSEQAAATESSTNRRPIFRIPQNLRVQLAAGDEKAYIPEIVSLGPHHYGKEQLRGMDEHKIRALARVLSRTSRPLEHYLVPMHELEPVARECYEEPINMNVEDCAEMLLLDGCFMLEIILGYDKGFESLKYPLNDPIFSKRGNSSIVRDMIKLENQIPFFVLKKLLDLQGELEDLTLLVASMLIRWLTGEKLESIEIDLVIVNAAKIGPLHHCLDLFHQSLVAGVELNSQIVVQTHSSLVRTTSRSFDKIELRHNATDLCEYGIKFKRARGGQRAPNFTDIKFEKKRVLEIPRIVVNDRFKATFLNLITFEQHFRSDSRSQVITDYIAFMDKLVNSGKDVGLLQHAGIIVHNFSSDAEVADVFNDLGKAVFLDTKVTSCYSDLCEQINRRCNRWNLWKSDLEYTYFSSPWTTASLLAAIVLLVLSFLQTFYTIYPYYKPRSHS